MTLSSPSDAFGRLGSTPITTSRSGKSPEASKPSRGLPASILRESVDSLTNHATLIFSCWAFRSCSRCFVIISGLQLGIYLLKFVRAHSHTNDIIMGNIGSRIYPALECLGLSNVFFRLTSYAEGPRCYTRLS